MSTHMLHAIRTQVMWNRLIAVVEEQAQALLRTAFGHVAREAGDLVRRARVEGVQIARTKTSGTDIVTAADRASEELISSRIRAASSNCRSRAAAIICAVMSLIRSASSARGMLAVSRPSNTPALTARPGSPGARRPRDALRPEPPTSTAASVSSASRYT